MTAAALIYAHVMERAPAGPQRQRGQVLLLLLLVLVTGAAYLLMQSLSAASIATERDRITQQALAEAKAALIAYAVTYSETHPGSAPGYLPCPDMSAGGVGSEGSAEGSCGAKDVSVIGRLPWKTLGLPPLRDGAGECLWYALSGAYKNNPKTDLMNSNTSGQFEVMGPNGTTYVAGPEPESRAVAIVFAPGVPIAGQARGSVGAATQCGGNYIAANYLDTDKEIDNSALSPGAKAVTRFIAGAPSRSFNDRLLAIRHDELFTAINKKVAAAIRGSVDPLSGIQGYYAQQVPKQYPWAGDGSGHQIPGETAGPLPYEDLPLDPGTKNVLQDNGWFDPGVTVYTVSPDRSRATITIQNPAVSVCLEKGKIVPCP